MYAPIKWYFRTVIVIIIEMVLLYLLCFMRNSNAAIRNVAEHVAMSAKSNLYQIRSLHHLLC